MRANFWFDADMEQELADHVKTLANQFHGLDREVLPASVRICEKKNNNTKMPRKLDTRQKSRGIVVKGDKKTAQS